MDTDTEPAAGESVTDFYDGENLLRVVATAIMRLAQGHLHGKGSLYDAAIQQAYDHLVLHSLRTRTKPPHSVAEMARWAAEVPLGRWPITISSELLPPETLFVDPETRAPTQQCAEWAVSSPSAVSEVYQNAIMVGALDLARSLEAPEIYTSFRRLLIKRPVLTAVELTRASSEPGLDAMAHLLKRAYLRAPAAYLHDGVYLTCARCGCLLVRGASGRLLCELDRCRRDGRPRVGRSLPAARDGGVYQVGRPLRMFVTGPGLAETDLECRLTELGVAVEMWPGFDAYDLRVTFPSGEVWAIDVKDRANPALLGRASRPLPAHPPYDRAFLVVPRYRFDDREDYARVFRHHRPADLEGRLDLLTDDGLLKRARAKTASKGRADEVNGAGDSSPKTAAKEVDDA